MRILFFTNFYPPSNYGWGYMQLCEEVVDGLAARGHEVAVLTGTRRDGPEVNRPYPVHRLLPIDPDWQSGKSAARQFFFGRRRRERQAVDALQHLVSEFRPEIIFVWHAIGLPRVLLKAAEQTAPTVYYLAGYLPELPDEYIAYWHLEPAGRYVRLLKRPLAKMALAILRHEGKPIALKYEHVICVSDYVQRRLVDKKLISPGAVVIHNGVDVQHFASSRPSRRFEGKLALLCAGRLEPDKGVHHVIEALGLLDREQRDHIDHLAIVGDGQPAYAAYLRSLVVQHNLSEIVRFASSVPRDEMPRLLDGYDVLILPSALEALSRMMQEAMAVGLLVIGTTSGGSGEVLVDEKTGLVFEVGTPRSLAVQLARVVDEPQMAESLARAGQQTVRESFNIERTITRIEQYLHAVGEALP